MKRTITIEVEIPVIVPHGRTVWMVEATDGLSSQRATKITAGQMPGQPWSIETWMVNLEEPPIKVIIQMNPVVR